MTTADISALLPKSVGCGFLVKEDQREVCRLSPRDDVVVRLNPYPAPYRLVLACSLFLYLLSDRLTLRLAFLAAGALRPTTGLPRSAAVPRWGGTQLFAGGATSTPGCSAWFGGRLAAQNVYDSRVNRFPCPNAPDHDACRNPPTAGGSTPHRARMPTTFKTDCIEAVSDTAA